MAWCFEISFVLYNVDQYFKLEFLNYVLCGFETYITLNLKLLQEFCSSVLYINIDFMLLMKAVLFSKH